VIDDGLRHVEQEEADDLVIVPRRDLYPDQAEEQGEAGQSGGRSSPADRTTTRRRPVEPLPKETRPELWYTLEQAAAICHRAPGTISNLVGRFQLPRHLGWRVTNRKRRRAVLLAPATVAWLQQKTLLAPMRDRRAERQAAR
jgi:hypothetical protein